MKYLATLLLTIGLGLSAFGQTIKSLGYNATNGHVVYNGTNPLTFTNELNANVIIATNISADEVGAKLLGKVQIVDGASTNGFTFESQTDVPYVRTNLGLGWPALTNTNAATSLLGFTTNGQVVANTGTNVLTFTSNVAMNKAQLPNGTFVDEAQFAAPQFGNAFLSFEENRLYQHGLNILEWSTNGAVSFGNAAATRANLGFSTNLNTLWTATNASNAANSIGAITATNAAATVTTFSSPNISNNITLTNVSTNTLQGNITYRVFIYSAAYSDGTNGWQIRNNVSAVPNISISLAPTRALNGGNWGMGGAITDINNTVSLATSAGQLYIYANTYIFRHTNNVTLNVQFAQNTSGATYSAVSGTIVIEPIAW